MATAWRSMSPLSSGSEPEPVATVTGVSRTHRYGDGSQVTLATVSGQNGKGYGPTLGFSNYQPHQVPNPERYGAEVRGQGAFQVTPVPATRSQTQSPQRGRRPRHGIAEKTTRILVCHAPERPDIR